MDDLTEWQQEQVREFMSATGTSENYALDMLWDNYFDLQIALENHVPTEPVPEPVDTSHLVEIYNNYKDPGANMILIDGITQICNDLQVDPQDIVMVVLSWHMKAATMCEFSEQEIINGFQSLEVNSMDQLREKVPFMRSELQDEQKFREIYNFAFGWAKDKGQKSLALDTAIEMWKLLLADKQWPFIDHWLQFVQGRHNKAIIYDIWSQLLEFAVKVDPTFSNYDPDGAWPYLIDEFVDYLTENGIVQKGQAA